VPLFSDVQTPLREILEVYLMTDAGAGRNDAEIVERFLAPAQELVALAVALELDIDVLLQRVRARVHVHHHRVVDHEIDRHQRVHLLRVAAELGDAVAHRGEIDHGGNAREILHQDARGPERHFLAGAALLEPAGDRLCVLGRVARAILEAEHVLEQHLQAHRQARHVADLLRRFGDREIRVGLALDVERLAGFKGVLSDGCHGSIAFSA
jgi:hypothetical protein